MGSYRLSKAAESDLVGIARYSVENHGIEQAIAYRDALLEACQFLAEHPKSARLRTELNPPLRAHRFQSHMLIYTIEDDGSIFIIRIRHDQEDWSSDPMN